MALDYEQQYYSSKIKYIVGCDEAGRGCLLGDVFAGAVILPKDFKCDLINDSKQLSEKQREEAFKIIKEHAIAWGVGRCTAEEIDQINILNASRLAMERAIDNMNHRFHMHFCAITFMLRNLIIGIFFIKLLTIMVSRNFRND